MSGFEVTEMEQVVAPGAGEAAAGIVVGVAGSLALAAALT